MIMRIALCLTNHVAGIEERRELQSRQVRLMHTAQSVGATAEVLMFGLLHRGRPCIDAVTEDNQFMFSATFTVLAFSTTE